MYNIILLLVTTMDNRNQKPKRKRGRPPLEIKTKLIRVPENLMPHIKQICTLYKEACSKQTTKK